MKTYYIESLGCPRNLVDSEVFASIFQRAGYQPCDQPEDVDIVLVNTCSFIADALLEMDAVLDDMGYLKQDGRIDKLLVTGCITNHNFEDIPQMYPFVDGWIPLKDFATLENWLELEHAPSHRRKAVEVAYHRYLRISDGCNNHCAYCAIPSIRGPQVSVPIEELVAEAEYLAADEYYPPRELILVSEDTCNYGLDLYGRQALPELIERLHALPAYDWIRLMYLHPDHFDPRWLELWERFPKLMPYFEIPIQHCQDRLLQAMNRKKGGAELEELFQTIRSKLPQAVFRTSLIAGLPGETPADASALKKFIQRVEFTWLGVFAYSREKGTPAARMDKQVPEATAERRQDKLLDIQSDITKDHLDGYVGQDMAVLIEQPARVDAPDVFAGRTWFQAPEIDGITYVHGSGIRPGFFVLARVVDAIGTDLFCEMLPSD